jgi:prepilin-type N-terminal cleavage/methylation domain-containing protein
MRQTIRAFTLLELLLVVGIIAILAALIFPALGSARERAQVIQCRNNLRQQGMALAAYASDHRQFPYAYFNAPTMPTKQFSWFGALTNPGQTNWGKGILKCPAYKWLSYEGRGDPNAWMAIGSYSYNATGEDDPPSPFWNRGLGFVTSIRPVALHLRIENHCGERNKAHRIGREFIKRRATVWSGRPVASEFARACAATERAAALSRWRFLRRRNRF